MVIAFWLGVTNAWLNLVKASVKTRMFSLPSFKRIYFGEINTHEVHWVISYNDTQYCVWLGVISLCNLTSWTFFYILCNILEHGVPIELLPAEGSSSFNPLMTLAIMKQSKHLCLIFYREDHADETLHHCGCIINVEHPFSKSVCQTGAGIFSQP